MRQLSVVPKTSFQQLLKYHCLQRFLLYVKRRQLFTHQSRSSQERAVKKEQLFNRTMESCRVLTGS